MRRVGRFVVNVAFRNMRRGETVEIPDDELVEGGPWDDALGRTGRRPWLRAEPEPEGSIIEPLSPWQSAQLADEADLPKVEPPRAQRPNGTGSPVERPALVALEGPFGSEFQAHDDATGED